MGSAAREQHIRYFGVNRLCLWMLIIPCWGNIDWKHSLGIVILFNLSCQFCECESSLYGRRCQDSGNKDTFGVQEPGYNEEVIAEGGSTEDVSVWHICEEFVTIPDERLKMWNVIMTSDWRALSWSGCQVTEEFKFGKQPQIKFSYGNRKKMHCTLLFCFFFKAKYL